MSINRKKSCEEGMVQKTDNTDELEVLKMENSRLQKLTQQDSLTGLLNRRAIESEVNKLLTDKIPGVFLMMDIDEFKYINDKYGHLTGDRTLVELSRIMELCFFRKDLIGRIGGDEFAVFLPNQSDFALSEIDQLINDKTIYHNTLIKRNFKVELSYGISLFDQYQDLTVRELLDKADREMYCHKRNKKGNRRKKDVF